MIARKHNNTFMESNILQAIALEKDNPSIYEYKKETED